MRVDLADMELITREEYEAREWYYDPRPLPVESREWAEEFLELDNEVSL